MMTLSELMKSSLGRLRVIAFIEGISYLVLLGIAMPLKYFAGLPQVVSVVGMIHGVLFVAFCLALLQAFLVHRWNILRGFVLFVSALIPLGTFWAEVKILRPAQEALKTTNA